MANKLELFHEKTNKGNYIQHIKVNGIELSGRTVNKSDDEDLYNREIAFLNDKAQLELEKNPKFFWANLEEWRVWANGYTKEFLAGDAKIQEDLIRKSVLEANK